MFIHLHRDDVTKTVADSLNEDIDSSRTLRVIQHSEDLYEVQRSRGEKEFRVVDLNNLTCSCGKPQEEVIPCKHVCAAMIALNKDPRVLVQLSRRVGALQDTYSGTINTVDMSQIV